MPHHIRDIRMPSANQIIPRRSGCRDLAHAWDHDCTIDIADERNGYDQDAQHVYVALARSPRTVRRCAVGRRLADAHNRVREYSPLCSMPRPDPTPVAGLELRR
jgi:hypothetical protein